MIDWLGTCSPCVGNGLPLEVLLNQVGLPMPGMRERFRQSRRSIVQSDLAQMTS